MYDENNRNFALKNFVLKLLLIVILVFLIIWLFPTKSYVNNLIDSKLGTSKEQIFNTNINTMKEAAISYYSGERLPETSSKITLEEMLNKNLLIEFKDSNNKKCDTKKSYAKITKNEEDYTLKVNLTCSDTKGHIISYLTYNDAGDVYEKKKLTEDDTEEENTEPTSSENTVAATPSNTQSGYYTNYGSWSAWSTNYVSNSNTRQVETKVEKVQTGSVKVQDGTTTETKSALKVRTTINGKTKYVYVCPSDYDNHGTYDYNLTCYKTVAKYENKALYKNVTYYRYRDRSYVSN